MCVVAGAISFLTATLNIGVYVCVYVYVFDITSSFFFPGQGHQWSVEVKSYKSSILPLPCPTPTYPSITFTPPHHLSSHSHPDKVLSRPRSHSYLGPLLLSRVCGGSEAAEGNYSSALIGIIILVGWQRWITQQDPATVGIGAGGGGEGGEATGRQRKRCAIIDGMRKKEERSIK